MPLFDHDCDACGWYGELFSTIAARDEQVCPECAAPTTRILAQVAQAIGALHSRPIDYSKQIRGAKFDSNAQARAFERDMESKGWFCVSKSDGLLRGWMDEFSESREQKAMKQGWRNEAHRLRMTRAAADRENRDLAEKSRVHA